MNGVTQNSVDVQSIISQLVLELIKSKMPIRQNVLINESDIRNPTGTVLQQTNESIGSDLTNKNMENVCRTQTGLQYIVNKEAEYRQIDGTTFFRFEPNVYNLYWHPMRL